MNSIDQTLLYGASALVLVGTLVVFVVQYVRMNRKDKGDD